MKNLHIVIAYGTANIMIVPVLQSFGLIFKDKFQDIGMNATDSSLILNLNSALGMTLGLFNGVLLKKYGYRKIALLGGSLYSSGLLATSWANSFTHFLITYSIITSIGMGLCSSSFSLALHTYFKEDRNKAAGIGMTITGLGPIFLPQLASLLIMEYGAQGCVLIIGAISLHIISAALVLKPYKPPDENRKPEEHQNFKVIRFHIDETSFNKPPVPNNSRSLNLPKANSWDGFSEDENDYLEQCPIYHDVDTQSIYGFDITTQPIRKSEEYIWQDLNYKFRPKEIVPRSCSAQNVRHRSGDFVRDSHERERKRPQLIPYENPKRWFESGSQSSVHLGSSMKIFEEKHHSRTRLSDNFRNLGRRLSHIAIDFSKRRSSMPVSQNVSLSSVREEDEDGRRPRSGIGGSFRNFGRRLSTIADFSKRPSSVIEVEEEEDAVSEESIVIAKPPPKKNHLERPLKCLKNGWYRFVKVFDLGLLNDPIYLNMMIGISVAVFAEINFSLLTPFILNEFNYSTGQIAMFMSTLALVDICCRFVSPFVGDYFKQPPRIMFMYSLMMLIVNRSCLLIVNSYVGLLIVAAGLGLSKGVRTVYMTLVVPNYIPIERLPAASGIQMVANGILLLSMGSLVGVFRDLFGSYSICIIFINLVTFTTLVLWTAEMYYMKKKNSKKEEEETPQIDLEEVKKLNIIVNVS